MLKRSFWLAMIVAPLCFAPACELVSDAVKKGGLEGGYGSGGSTGMDPGPDGKGAHDGAGAKDGWDGHPMCKPVDKEATKCPAPRWEDTDKDGCIDQYYCDDPGGMEPVECKPFPKELLIGCEKPLIEDRDGDGCIDYFACLDGKGDPVGGPDDKEPTMCKPLPSTEGCAKPHFEDRDGDGCMDLYVCLDYFDGKSDVPPPPKK